MFFLELSVISKKSHLIYWKSVSDMTVFSKKNCEEGHTLEVSEKKKNPSSFSFLKKLSCHFQMFKLINLTTKIFFSKYIMNRGGSRTAATSKMERFVIIVNGWKPLTIITKRSILDVAAVLDASLMNAV